ncbi:hypothetical protein FRACYDRAFT_262122 [Fragilariopsis cylindrus CCMP1102]|uniref:Ribosomal protein L9 domain-containing protein n=1 Tax=Fragilariopsis cylindrus CCMP1102 TaxID=635003 RepID=A0A1E7F9N1_9STRA|nr:hypothetical protein FRACYDRAFT_262122 [Fragilariopsis cylindrus CCMP1102]|eukprot:OEU14867.1 hypothetical protein FRACYDRAFT_262122 [Fragilariopsis cylindrus CCMP1102]
MGHTVRLIAMEDLPHGKAYKGDVVKVKAGYARNHLVPQKLALYATPQNFERLGMIDPDYETEEQRLVRLERELNMTASEDKYLKEADLLKRYLKNKVLQIWRMVDPNSTDTLHPGVVTTENLREKMSKQLKIDLNENEAMHIFREDADNNTTDSSDSSAANTTTTTTTTTTNPINFAEIDEVKIQAMIDDFIPTTDTCPIKINRLGDYLAVIGLKGGYTVPLRFVVRQRAA